VISVKKQPAVFLDRDGVINRAIVRDGKPFSPRMFEEFELADGVDVALQAFRNLGLMRFIVTNQPDVVRGLMTVGELEKMHTYIRNTLPVDGIFVCPHDDADGCRCRKPKPGLLLEAAQKWGVHLPSSFMIGDSWKDMEAGARAGCMTILLDMPYNLEASCHHRVADLEAAVEIVKGLCVAN
jgi:D-glycero-D-manno-heptose 1,7-bisphosphate phosphatase